MIERQHEAREPLPPPSAAANLGETLPELPGLGDALLASSGAFLEVGCGYGVRSRRLFDEGALQRFETVVLTDIVEERVQHAKRHVPEATTLVCDGMQLPFADGSFDFVFSDQVIEHVKSDAAMLREVFRVLRPGGQAYVGSVQKRPWAWYFYRNGGHWRLDPTHVREYASMAEYLGLFTGAGLSVAASWNAPMKFPLGEAILRTLVRTGFVRAGRFYDAHDRSWALRTLSRGGVTIPGYYACWALVRK
jgi:ubiquinone/menaquinone biosynthesis C-methylase UbiE